MADAQTETQSSDHPPESWWRFSIALVLAGGCFVLLVLHVALFLPLRFVADLALPEMESAALRSLLRQLLVFLCYASIVFMVRYSVPRKYFKKTMKIRELNFAMNNDYSVFILAFFVVSLGLYFDSIIMAIVGAQRYSTYVSIHLFFYLFFFFEPLIVRFAVRYIDWRMPEHWHSITRAAEGPRCLRWPMSLLLVLVVLTAIGTLLPSVLSLLELLQE